MSQDIIDFKMKYFLTFSSNRRGALSKVDLNAPAICNNHTSKLASMPKKSFQEIQKNISQKFNNLSSYLQESSNKYFEEQEEAGSKKD